MTLDQMASELRGIPDSALQTQAQNPSEIPGYLVANEILRRQQERSQAQQQGNQGPQPTILSQLAKNLPPPQAPQVKSMPEVPFAAVPQRNLAGAQSHFAPGGEIDPDSAPDPTGESIGDVPTWTPPSSTTPMSEKVPAGVNINAPGAYSSSPVTNYPQTSTSPLQNPPNTHQGGRGFLQTLAALAPVFQYAGNIGAGAAMPHGNFASGVGYANQVLERQQELKDAAAEKAAERAQQQQYQQQQLGLEGRKMQMEALMSGAKFVGPDGKIQEAPVTAPQANINGVPMGGGQIAGSGAVPMNAQMTQMTGAPGINAQKMDYSDILTPQKQQEIALQNKYNEEEHQAALRIQEQQANWIAVPPELATNGIQPWQKVPPATFDTIVHGHELHTADLPLGQDKAKQLNQISQSRWEVLNPGTPLPPQFMVGPNNTLSEYKTIDEGLKSVQSAAGTQEQRDTANQFHRDAMAIAAGNRETKQDTQAKEAALKQYTPTMDAAKRFNTMSQNYYDAKNGDQQAMLSMLTNHLGMTMGDIKGGRLNQAVIQEAIASRPWLQGMASKFDSNGLLSGVTLTKPQMEQMLKLGREKYVDSLSNSRSNAKYLGINDDGPARVPSEATKRYYGDLAAGDRSKAKALATADGWTVE